MEERGFSDLLSTASSFLSSQSQSFGQSSSPSQSSTPSDTPPTSGTHNSSHSSYEDVMSSAQVIMNAAKSKLHKGGADSGEEIDMGKLAGAASNIVGAAVHYGKLENSSYGKYAQKAEDYLHSYEVKHAKPNVASAGSAARQGFSQGYPSQGYGESAQGSRPAGSQGFSQGYSEPAQQKQDESQDYPTGYPPAGYPTSDSGRRYY